MTRTQATQRARKMAKASGEGAYVVYAGREDGMDPNGGYQAATEEDVETFFADAEIIDFIER